MRFWKGSSVWLALAATIMACATNGDTALPNKGLFVEVAPDSSGLAFTNQLLPSEALNIITYLYYFNGGGIAAGDVNGDGLIDLYFTANQGADALFLNQGDLKFQDVTTAAGLSPTADWSTGASFVDIDGDGDLDLYVNKASGIPILPDARNELYLNDGSGHYTEAAASYGLDLQGLITQTALFDADKDGDLDAYVLRQSMHDPARYSSGDQRDQSDSFFGDQLLIQGEDGKFADASAQRGIYASRLGYGLGLAVADFDNDSWLDLAVSNDFGEHDYFYLGGEAGFSESSTIVYEHTSQFSMGSAAADINVDGRLDLLTLDMRPSLDSVRKSSVGADDPSVAALKRRLGFHAQYARNALQLNTESGFVDVAASTPLHSTDWSWAPVVFDADLDGLPDVFIANGIPRRPNDLDYLKFGSGEAVQRSASNLELAEMMPPGLASNRAFRQSPNFAFEEMTQSWGLQNVGATTAALAIDLDGDGDEDLVTNNVNGSARLYENTTVSSAAPAANTLRIELTDGYGSAASQGATVTVTAPNYRSVHSMQPVTGFQSAYAGPLLVHLPPTVDPAAAVVSIASPAVYRLVDSSTVLVRRFAEAEEAVVADAQSLWHLDSSALGGTSDYTPFDTDPLLPFTTASVMTSSSGLYQEWDTKPRTVVAIVQGQRYELVATPATVSGQPWRMSTRLIIRDGAREASTQLVDTTFEWGQITDAVWVDDALYVASLWQPVRKVNYDQGAIAVEEITPPGLWLSITQPETSRPLLVLGNIGTNTLLAERKDQQLSLYAADYDGNGRIDPIVVRDDDAGGRTLFGLDEIAGQMPAMRKFFTRYLPFSASPFDRLFMGNPAAQTALVQHASELRSGCYSIANATWSPLPSAAQRGALDRVILTGKDSATIEFRSVVGHPAVGNPSRRSVSGPIGQLLPCLK